jgi:hypothetical protein
MEDTDVLTANMNIRVLTEEPLNKVVGDIEKAFKDYDANVPEAEELRQEYGWGLESFVNFLRTRYPDWTIISESPNASVFLVKQ